MTDLGRPARAGGAAVGLARWWPVRYVLGALLWTGCGVVPVLLGLLLKATFDALTGAAPAGLNAVSLIVLLAVAEALRMGILYSAFRVWARWWAGALALLRTNLLRAQVVSGGLGAGAPARRPGAAITVFRDDAKDVVSYADIWVDFVSALVFGVVAVAVMVRIDALLTLVVVLPFAAAFLVTLVLAGRIRRVRRADREATARVTGLLAELFSAVLTVKVAGAENRAVRRLSVLNRDRRATSLRDKVLTQTLEAFNGSTVELTVGLVLLLVAGRMRAGTFTVGDLALFTLYLSWLSHVPRLAGLVLVRHRHAQVAVGRMSRLLPDGDGREAVVPQPLHLHRLPVTAPQPRAPRPPAPTVELIGFGVAGVVTDVDLRVAPGSFTVVTGPVGAGKSMLLRGLLGLVGPAEGTVRWDGAVVDDLAAHFVPPRCAFVPQVPAMFSATMRDNLALGRTTSEELLHAALFDAAFDTDVADMPDGIETRIGPRGVRLSGGQLQRAATARALVADAALLVFDDLSSALDAATEQQVWARLLAAEPRPTVLVVSHRAAAMTRADQVVVVDGGRVRGDGNL